MYFEKSKKNIEFDRNQLEFICLEQLVPNDHLVRKIEAAVDFEFIHKITKDYYSQDNGRPCLDTIILFKIILLNFLFGKNSVRAIIEEAKVNMAYRWFLGLSMSDKIPNYSVFSQNYIRRYKDSNVFETIFTTIVARLIDQNLIDSSVIFVDGTHIKASANKQKLIKKEIEVISDKFQKELENEIDEFREINGRNKYNDDDDDDDNNYEVDDFTGEVKKVKKAETKVVTKSVTDPDAGMFVKGEHERQFAYVDQVACDKYGWVLGFDVNPGNMHDSKAFLPFFEKTLLPFNPNVICADAAYLTGLIAKNVQYNKIQLLTPYVRPKGIRTEFGKKSFSYQIEIDAYLCPNRKTLTPTNIRRDGNIEYTISRQECRNCPLLERCMKSYSQKTITRHLYSDCVELAKDYRLSPEGKQIYKQRKETIERTFAEGKEQHGLRYTRYRGLEKNRHYRCLLFACMNIKKLALLLFRRGNQNEKLKYS